MNGSSPVFVLLTDFGLADPYAGQLRAALFSRAPQVPILDLSHEVPPFSVATGAFFLAASRRHYPPGAIFLCVVDPGVGSDRKLLCVTGREHTLLGPDNGLLALACRDMLREGAISAHEITKDTALPANTFHGRDVLAPAAAALALGAAPSSLGPLMDTLPDPPGWAEAVVSEQGIHATVLHVDRFGNCVLNLTGTAHASLVPPLMLESPGGTIPVLVTDHYAVLPPGIPGIIPGSQGYCELAFNNAPAAVALGLHAGAICRIHKDTP